MGAVWRGRDVTLDRVVALKRIGVAPGGQTPDLRRAEREARLAAMVQHPHVVAVFDMVEDDHQQWLVMEYVEGRSLAQLIRENGPLDPAFVASALAQVADALSAAHAAGVVHRDVKPSNILVTDAGVAKLTDFGIARSSADDNQITRTGLVSGSPAYLAPEVASGRPATAASDVWALGATLYHALAGQPPYSVGENVMGVLYQIVHEEPPRLAEAGWLGDLLLHTMARQKDQRWPMAVAGTYLRHGPEGVRKLGVQVGRPAPTAPTPTAPVAQTQVSGRRVVADSTRPATSDTPTPAADAGAGAPTRRRRAAPAAPAPRGRRRMRGVNLLLVLLTMLLVGALAYAAWMIGRDTNQDPQSGGSSPTAETTTSPSPTTSSSPTPRPSESGMEHFVRNYLAQVAIDPAVAWSDLTPAFQKDSGGIESYRTFWVPVTNAVMSNFSADPQTLTVTYDVSYTKENGENWTDRGVTLVLEFKNGVYRIAGEPPK